MADDPTKRGSADAKRINVHEEHEVRYWTEKFKCTKSQLESAVRAVGPMAANVEQHLRGVK